MKNTQQYPSAVFYGVSNLLSLFYSVPVAVRSIVINPSVCVSVCSRAYLWSRWTDLHKILYADLCGHGLVLLWWRCATRCASGFMDDVTLAVMGAMPKRGGCTMRRWPSVAWRYRGGVWCLWMLVFWHLFTCSNKCCSGNVLFGIC